ELDPAVLDVDVHTGEQRPESRDLRAFDGLHRAQHPAHPVGRADFGTGRAFGMTPPTAMHPGAGRPLAPTTPADGSVIANGTVVTMNRERQLVADGAVLVKGDRIAAIGKATDLLAANPGAEVVDATGCLVTPGFVDAHNHPAHFLSKG